jgi:HPt (histidine-containing phosphotransfer) domain-containing protein
MADLTESVSKLGAADHKFFDRESLLNRIGGNEALANKLIQMFLGDAPGQIEHIRAAITAGDCKEAGRLAHKIGGAAANMGCEHLSSAAKDMEKSGKAGDLEALTKGIPNFEEQFRLTVKEMQG